MIRLPLRPGRIVRPWLLLLLVLPLILACAPIAQPPTAPPGAENAAAPTALPPSDNPILPAENPPTALLNSPWRTDFTRRTVPWSEIRSGGPPKDGIPAIDAPTFEAVDMAASWLSDRDPVIVFGEAGDVRAYPLAILIWHEIVNDTVGGLPVAVTFCPLCNASIVFDRRFQDEILDFGTTGLLRNSDLVMYDRQSETWWQQFTGEGLAGKWAGERLDFHTSQVISFGDFKQAFPDGQVLARPAFPRSYGLNPYVGYDGNDSSPFLFSGEIDRRVPATIRVLGLHGQTGPVAYRFPDIAAAGAINDLLGDIPIVVWHKRGTASALDTRAIAEGWDVGSAAAFDRRVDGRTLTFRRDSDGLFMDEETGSRWTIVGRAVEGQLSGAQLAPMIAFDHFWFAWAAFHPDTTIYGRTP